MAWKYPLIDRIVAGEDRWLTQHPSVERALGAAWATARPGGKRRLIAAMLERGRPDGLETLIRRLHELDPHSQDELARRITRLHAPLRRVMTRGDDADHAGVRNALTLIAAAGAGGLGYLVTAKLRHADPDIRAQAGRVLRALTLKTDEMEPGEATRLVDAVNEAVARFGHHRHPAALRAWLTLAPRGLTAGEASRGDFSGGAVEALQDAEHAAVGPIRELLQHAGDDEVRRGLVASLALPTLALAAVAGLRECVAGGKLGEAIAGREHLLDLPAVRRGLAKAGDPTDLLPPPPEIAAAVSDAAAISGGGPAWAAWIDALPLPPLGKAIRLARLMETGTDAARLAGVRRLLPLAETTDHGDPRAAAEALRAITNAAEHDESLAVARLAGTWLLAEPQRATDALGAALRSVHEPVRRAATRRLGATAFERMWSAWPKLNDRARLDAARAALRLDPTARQRLEAQLRGGGSARQRAVEIVTLVDRPRNVSQSGVAVDADPAGVAASEEAA